MYSTQAHELARQRVKYLVEQGGLLDPECPAILRRPTRWLRKVLAAVGMTALLAGGGALAAAKYVPL